MLPEYLIKYNQLPPEILAKASSPATMSAISEIEAKYGVKLGVIVMKILTKTVVIDDITPYFSVEYGIEHSVAQKLINEIKEKVLFVFDEYLRKEKNQDITKEVIEDKRDDLARQMEILARENKVPVKNVSSSFYFSSDDEEEIRGIARKLEASNTDEYNIELERKVDRIIKETGLIFSASFMADRFKQVMKTYLKGIRDRIDTKQVLFRPYEQGGLGLEKDIVESVIKATETVEKNDLHSSENQQPAAMKINEQELEDDYFGWKNKIKDQKIVDDLAKPDIMEKLKSIGARDFEYDLASEIEKKKKTEENNQGKIDIEHELMPPTPKLISQNEIFRSPFPTETKSDQYKTKPEPAKQIEVKKFAEKKSTEKVNEQQLCNRQFIPQVNITRSKVDGKVKMEDIKHIPLSLDSIDELRYLTLINFRRLGKTATESANKVKTKLKILEEEKFSRGLEGLKAWRQSPVNRLYIQIGQESIEKKADISIIAAERKKNGQEYLEEDEFNAIMDLNRDMRF